MSNVVKAACILLFSEDYSRVLAVSRKDDHTAFGIPGGKLDPNESFVEAAKREALEETGYTINISKTSEQNPFDNVDVDNVVVETYVATINKDVPRKQISVEETGLVEFVTPEVLYSGPFKEYNKKLLNWYDKLPIQIKSTI